MASFFNFQLNIKGFYDKINPVMIMDKPRRKQIRLKNYDYSSSGYYFVTICSYNRKPIFSKIVGQGLAPAATELTLYGKIAQKQLLDLENRFKGIKIDKYIIMPNHIHIIVVINKTEAGASPCPTLSDVICAFKSLTVRECNAALSHQKLFQASFHDHIIRGEKDYEKIWQYIDSNASKWIEDCFYIGE